MTFFDEHSGRIVAGFITSAFAGLLWLVRTIFTNNKRLDLLEQKTELQHDEVCREIKGLKETNSESLQRILERLDHLGGNS